MRTLSSLPTIGTGVWHSYAAIFFSQSRLLGIWMIATSLLSLNIGLGGLIAAIVANAAAWLMGLDRTMLKEGVWGFNAVFLGMGVGAVFEPGWVALFVLIFATLLALFATILVSGFLAKYGLPFLSLPFLIAIWLVLLASRQLPQMTVSDDHIFYLNTLYRSLGEPLAEQWLALNAVRLPWALDVYLRSLGTIFFHPHVVVGAMLAVGLLAWSRVAFVLSLTGFYAAYGFYVLIGADLDQLNQAYLGFNFILTAIALGGYFVIPSRVSYLLVVLLTPVGVLITLALQSVLSPWMLPIFSLPFTLTVMLVLFALRNTFYLKGLALTTYQYHQPERNHYRHFHATGRYRDAWRLPLSLPVMGEWFVSQGHDGNITHKGAWGKAWDLVLTDAQGKTFSEPGTQLEHYFCYGKPVLAPADGWVDVVVDYVEENEIGGVNIQENWGNSVVIRHAEGLYSQLSHLKAGSILVHAGAYVHKGQAIASVGNSGRSPEPHLHWQVQTTPFVGSQTLDYPLAAYLVRKGNGRQLQRYARPEVATYVSNPETDALMRTAFGWLPGTRLAFRVTGKALPAGCISGETVVFTCHTNALNQTYLRCENTGDVAYFTQNGTLLQFTEYYGKKGSLLWHLYTACYQVMQSYEEGLVLSDAFPSDHLTVRPLAWLQELTLPAGQWLETRYRLHYEKRQGSLLAQTVFLTAHVAVFVGEKAFRPVSYGLQLGKGRINSLSCSHSTSPQWEAICCES